MPSWSYGAVLSFRNVIVRPPPFRSFSHLLSRTICRAGVLKRCRDPASSSSSPLRTSPRCRNFGRMSARKTAQGLWNLSHGIVFAPGGRVVGSRLPLVQPRNALSTTSPAQAASSHDAETPDSEAVTAGAGQDPKQTATDEVKSLNEAVVTKATAPFTPLNFKIPDSVFQEAKNAPEGTPQSYWTYDKYRGPDEDGEPNVKVKVHYCRSAHKTEEVVKLHFMDEKLLGFDLEWMKDAYPRLGARANVSLIQLATPTRIGLFHVAMFDRSKRIELPTLKKVMENPEITKAGVWIKGDCTRMSKYLGIQSRGLFELSHLYRQLTHSKAGEYNLINKKLVALRSQVEHYLGLPLFKGEDVRMGNWSRPLDEYQILYSASDVYASVQLYAVLNHLRQTTLDPVPDLPHHAELDIPIPIARPVEVEESETEDQEATAAADGLITEEILATEIETLVIADQVDTGEDGVTPKKKRTTRKTVEVETLTTVEPEAGADSTTPKKTVTRRKTVEVDSLVIASETETVENAVTPKKTTRRKTVKVESLVIAD
ncbi:ribonuclease H-like domain-containing protein [Chaetomium sp. MPI-SDFR-AT-0129]|nr:ribonuclease H-like domain-containing protein [Chaetomium sp. MPI-SDFR-AT-0129]